MEKNIIKCVRNVLIVGLAGSIYMPLASAYSNESIQKFDQYLIDRCNQAWEDYTAPKNTIREALPQAAQQWCYGKDTYNNYHYQECGTKYKKGSSSLPTECITCKEYTIWLCSQYMGTNAYGGQVNQWMTIPQ